MFLFRLPRWFSGKESASQFRRLELGAWFGKIPWGRKWQPTPIFWPGKSHGLTSLGVAKSRTWLNDFTFTFSLSLVVQWVRLRASKAGVVGLIPGPGTKFPHAARCGEKVIFIHNRSRLETTQMSINKWMKKETVVHSHRGIPLEIKRNEWLLSTTWWINIKNIMFFTNIHCTLYNPVYVGLYT